MLSQPTKNRRISPPHQLAQVGGGESPPEFTKGKPCLWGMKKCLDFHLIEINVMKVLREGDVVSFFTEMGVQTDFFSFKQL